ncbi:hypothetical protein DFQ28_008650 [Apophysomyces sp. BC1034]|nr:hypothetical protein DFQ28_008650 [Apophysomyces sp. BC1034]
MATYTNHYHTFSIPVPSDAHYHSVIASDLLQRFRSGQDQDVFGIAVDRCNLATQLMFVRKVFLITMAQFLTVSCLTTALVRVDSLFQWLQNRLCSIVAICLSSPWLRYVFDMDPIQILWPMFLSCLVCIYLILDLYYVMGAVVPEDYILANVCFYVDLAYPVRCLHHCCELSDGLDASDILSPERSAPLDRR